MFIAKLLIHLIALSFLGYFYYQAITNNLGADPVEAILHFTGIGAFNLLILSLSLSPISQYYKVSWPIKLRRLLGLYSFVYALFHIVSFLAFEVQFDWPLFINEIIERPYITVGMLAFTILLSLAVTSFNRLKRSMGKKWQRLHNMVYFALGLVALHFIWSVKSDVTEPVIYIVISLLLLTFRQKKIKRWFNKTR